MNIVSRPFDGVIVMEPKRFDDERGFFLESFERDRYHDIGITENFVQDNHSRSAKNVLRGMHFTKKNPQAQIVTVMRGKIFDVVVDIRKLSPTFGKWFGIELSDECPRQVYMAHGFAHGFCVMSDWADLHYKVSHKYDANDNYGIDCNDPEIGIVWPIVDPIISIKDMTNVRIKDI